jgi:hypothetical protein
MKLRVYKIEAHEWEIVRQLRDLLKVSRLLNMSGGLGLTITLILYSLSYSRTQCCSSYVVARLALLLLFLLWTTSMNIWHQRLSPTSMTLQSELPFQLERRLSTGIMTGRTTRSCTALQWVSAYSDYLCILGKR